jgi:hypothetical protein
MDTLEKIEFEKNRMENVLKNEKLKLSSLPELVKSLEKALSELNIDDKKAIEEIKIEYIKAYLAK